MGVGADDRRGGRFARKRCRGGAAAVPAASSRGERRRAAAPRSLLAGLWVPAALEVARLCLPFINGCAAHFQSGAEGDVRGKGAPAAGVFRWRMESRHSQCYCGRDGGMSWSDIFPVLTEDMEEAYAAGATAAERARYEEWLRVERKYAGRAEAKRSGGSRRQR